MLTLNASYKSSPLIDSVPVPLGNDSYTSVAHRDLIHLLTGTFVEQGYDLERPQHQIHKKFPRFASVFSVSGNGLPKDVALDWMVGVLNSYDKSRSVTLLFGARVFVCSNGMVVADHKIRTRHTLNVWDRLPLMIAQAVGVFGSTVEAANKRNNRLKEFLVPSSRDIDAFAVEVCRKGLLPASKAVEYANEIQKPSYDYGVPVNSAWNIHNAFTHISKGVEPGTFSHNMIGFDKLLDRVFIDA